METVEVVAGAGRGETGGEWKSVIINARANKIRKNVKTQTGFVCLHTGFEANSALLQQSSLVQS